jgi:hypothetical protein
MAGLISVIPFGPQAIGAAGTETVCLITAPSNHRVKIRAGGLFTAGTAGTDAPCTVKLWRWDTGAGAGSSSLTPKSIAADPETPQVAAAGGYTSEPTYDEEIYRHAFHPQSGWRENWPLGGEIEIPGGAKVGIVVTCPQAQSVSGFVEVEE